MWRGGKTADYYANGTEIHLKSGRPLLDLIELGFDCIFLTFIIWTRNHTTPDTQIAILVSFIKIVYVQIVVRVCNGRGMIAVGALPIKIIYRYRFL